MLLQIKNMPLSPFIKTPKTKTGKYIVPILPFLLYDAMCLNLLIAQQSQRDYRLEQ